MELVHGEFTSDGPIGILPGSFHPPTVAHLGLAEAALARVRTVVFALPRVLPHKSYEGIARHERLALLQTLAAPNPRFAVAVTDGGLFVEMARELRLLHPLAQDVFLICGRDAAERIVAWPYSESNAIECQLAHYRLLVAARQGAFTPPPRIEHRIETLITESNWDDVSATNIRHAIEHGAPWRHLVPSRIHERVETLYSPSRVDSRNVRSR